MALSVFADKTAPPSDADLRDALGEALDLWHDVIAQVNAFSAVQVVWGFTASSTGWGLRVKAGDRVIMYMTPRKGYFLTSFALGKKPMAAARQLGLREDVNASLLTAKKYAEGYAVRLEVKKRADLSAVVAIARLKLAS